MDEDLVGVASTIPYPARLDTSVITAKQQYVFFRYAMAVAAVLYKLVY